MATHYIENGAGGSQYYFDANSTAAPQTQRSGQDRSHPAAVTAPGAVGSSEYSPYPAGVAGARSQPQPQPQSRSPYHEDDGQQSAQQHQSVAGFSKTAPQQQYQSSSPAPAPQVRATVRAIHTQDQQSSPAARSPQSYANYEQLNSPSSTPQASQYYHDPRQQSNPSSNYYQPSTSDQRTDSPTRGREQHVQAQSVPVRTMSSSSHQQYESSANHPQSHSSPQQQQQFQDQLQQYYSQLTPEQYQQLVRQQQLQRQQQDEQKRQQLAQQQYYLQQQQQQQQERQRSEQQVSVTSRPNPDTQNYEEYQQQQQRRIQSTSSNQDQQYRQQGQDQYDAYHQQRSQQIQSTHSPNVYQDPYRQVQGQQYPGQQSPQDAYYEQQRRANAQQGSPSPVYQQVSPNQQQQQQQHGRTDSERQRQDEQEYYAAQLLHQQQQEREHAAQLEAAQRQQAAQRAQQQQQQQQYQQYQQQQQQSGSNDQPAAPVGIRGLMNKFTGPTTVPTYEPKSKVSHSQQKWTTSYKTPSGSTQTTTTSIESSKFYSMTYSALPKSSEPPVNSAAYYAMLDKGGAHEEAPSSPQAGAPPHIQGPAPGFGALRDRFKGASLSDNAEQQQDPRRSQGGGSGLSSLRDQYINRAGETGQVQSESFSQRVQNVSRTIVGGEPLRSQPPPPAAAAPEPAPSEESHGQSQSVDDQGPSSEGALADGSSLSGASSLENETTINADGAETATATSS